METSGILANINRYVKLDDTQQTALKAILSSKTLNKREFLLEPGMICRHQSYVVSGCLRSFFIAADGSEQTIQFAIEDWFISDFNSYLNQAPGSLYVEAITPTTVLQLEYEATEALCLEHPIFERYFKMTAQKAFAFAQNRMLSNLRDSATERYLVFKERYPEIVERVPQYALASYLGMSAEFLSKIRKSV
ncbi:Crp/Fnr family transcriptional regulator [Gilvibacter sp.]|uniref:Crp/Fnr family transcriptional regulator n=1 Tax=Gilvibacter sp. TaxID=2729997 RepID=UPI003F49FC54